MRGRPLLPQTQRLTSTSVGLKAWQRRVIEAEAARNGTTSSAVMRSLLTLECARLLGERGWVDIFDDPLFDDD